MNPEAILLPAIGAIAGLGLFGAGLHKWNIIRLITHTPTSTIRSLAMGFAEIAGTVSNAKKYLQSPFTKQDCVYYDYRIEEERRTKKSVHWVTVKSGTERVPFCVKDKTGEVLVDPSGASFFVHETYNKIHVDIPTFVFGIFTGYPNFRRRYIEHALYAKNTVYVLGTAGDNPHVAEATSKHGMHDVMMQKSAHRPYYISDRPEKELVSSMTLMTTLLIVGGIALFLICLWLLLSGLR